MSMGSTPLAVTMETVICSWRELMCTTMKPLVINCLYFLPPTPSVFYPLLFWGEVLTSGLWPQGRVG